MLTERSRERNRDGFGHLRFSSVLEMLLISRKYLFSIPSASLSKHILTQKIKEKIIISKLFQSR